MFLQIAHIIHLSHLIIKVWIYIYCHIWIISIFVVIISYTIHDNNVFKDVKMKILRRKIQITLKQTYMHRAPKFILFVQSTTAISTVWQEVISRPSPPSPWTPTQCNLPAACRRPDPTLLSNNLFPVLIKSHSPQKLNYCNQNVEHPFVAYYQVSRNLPVLLNFDEPVGLMWIIDGCFPMAWLSQTKTNRVEWDHQRFILIFGHRYLINSKVIFMWTQASLCMSWPWTQRWDDNIW